MGKTNMRTRLFYFTSFLIICIMQEGKAGKLLKTRQKQRKGNDYVAVAYSDFYDGKIRFTGIYNDGSENSEQEYVEEDYKDVMNYDTMDSDGYLDAWEPRSS